MYRNTYLEINLKNIEKNVRTLINKYNDYKYYFGVVKADCYGHNGIKTVEAIIRGGCNYLAVATLDEAIEIRKNITNIPILCLGVIPAQHIKECLKNDITVTIPNSEYLRNIIDLCDEKLKVHIKVNTGMNRLGVKSKEEFNSMIGMLLNSNLILEGIYTHIYDPFSNNRTEKQFDKFEKITADIDLHDIPIVHISASEATMMYSKREYANGCRLGIAFYGLMDYKEIKLESTFSLYSEVIQINEIENETVGYDGVYTATGKEKIAVLPIGYADGIVRKNTGRDVYINNRPYKIIGNICMDMLFVKVDDYVKVGDKVTIIRDIKHIEEISNHIGTISSELICSIGKRVPRVYVE